MKRELILRGLLFLTFLCFGCTASRPHVVPPPAPVPPVVVFPPQKVMQTGKYAEFRDENEKLLRQCGDTSECEIALFNLGFVHAYPRSPYRNSVTALRYFDELVKKYPTSPWAYQGRMWVALIRENLALAEKRRQLQGSLRSSDAERRTLRDQLDRSRQIDLEMEQKERELLR